MNKQRQVTQSDNSPQQNYDACLGSAALKQENDQLLNEIQLLEGKVKILEQENMQLLQRCSDIESKYVEISNAFFWRITGPIRKLSTKIQEKLRKNDYTYLLFGTIKATMSSGIKAGQIKRADIKRQINQRKHGTSWPTHNELAKQKRTHFPREILISIVVPLYNTPIGFLSDMIASVVNQTYQNWELCLCDASDSTNNDVEYYCKKIIVKDKRIKYKRIKQNKGISNNTNECISMSTGDYIALLDHDDILHPCALFEVAKVINEADADFIYTDENTFTKSPFDAYCPNYKPDFAPDTLRSYNYICHLTVFARHLMEESGGGFRERYDGAQDYELFLRLTEHAKTIAHLPKILYFWRSHAGSTAQSITSKPYVMDAAKRALADHLGRIGLNGIVMDALIPSTYRIQYTITGTPLVSIIIPNKDHISDLKKCLSSIREKTTWNNLEIIIVENNSIKSETFQYYQEICAIDKRIRVIDWSGNFNFSEICNFGVKYSNGEYILLLNNDTEVISDNWIQEMLMYAQRADVGAVGAMLYYPDNTIQHAGVILGIGGIAGHSHKYFKRDSFGYMSRLCIAQNYSAVTAACAMFPRHIWEEVQGLDSAFAVAFNDVDLCMRIRSLGYLIVWTPYAKLYHYESKSRGFEDTPEKQARFKKEVQQFNNRWFRELEKGDPYYNPNLTLEKEDFSVR